MDQLNAKLGRDTVRVLSSGRRDALAEMATEQTREVGEFTVPGLGKLVKAERKERMGRNPARSSIGLVVAQKTPTSPDCLIDTARFIAFRGAKGRADRGGGNAGLMESVER